MHINILKHSLSSLRMKTSLTSDVDGLQGKGLLLIVNQSRLLCLISHCWQWLCWAGVWAVWTRYTHKIAFPLKQASNSNKCGA